MNKYYPGEPVSIYIQQWINIIPENNWATTIKKGKGKLPLFIGNVEQVIPIYDINKRGGRRENPGIFDKILQAEYIVNIMDG